MNLCLYSLLVTVLTDEFIQRYRVSCFLQYTLCDGKEEHL